MGPMLVLGRLLHTSSIEGLRELLVAGDPPVCATPGPDKRHRLSCRGGNMGDREDNRYESRSVSTTAPRKVVIRLPGKRNSNSHGARPVYQKHRWIRTSRLSMKNSLSLYDCTCQQRGLPRLAEEGRDSRRYRLSCTGHPTPHTHTPCTLHPTSHTPHRTPTPHTQHPTPDTPHPTPHTPHPTAHSPSPTSTPHTSPPG